MPYLTMLTTLIPLYLISRLMLLFMIWWKGGVWRLLTAHVITLFYHSW